MDGLICLHGGILISASHLDIPTCLDMDLPFISLDLPLLRHVFFPTFTSSHSDVAFPLTLYRLTFSLMLLSSHSDMYSFPHSNAVYSSSLSTHLPREGDLKGREEIDVMVGVI